MKEIITKSTEDTKKIGIDMAKGLSGGEVICLEGDLGAGKTTFTQGLLEGLGADGPYTSPTFAIMKKYETRDKNIYHIDTYRVEADDLLDLGWEEIIFDKNNIVIVEWPERVKRIIPKNKIHVDFKWINENKRKLIFK
jgi:tRNA threonylcarbamoyladenosine biosynthesis protein TsaE